MPDVEEPDSAFYDRADAHIHLANEHGDDVGPGKASASFLFAASRYNAFAISSRSASGAEMQASRGETVGHFVDQYRRMLENNVDDYIADFNRNLDGNEG
ncbi:MAG: hypothetical protein ACI89X_003678 [Planctomycetota bacterium]|jgi:hypothetical protein